MFLRNTIAKRSLPAKIGVSTGTGAKLHISFNRFVHCNAPGFFPLQRLAINHTINPNIRYIHYSCPRPATPLSSIPEPSQLASGGAPSTEQLVYQEMDALWSHPFHLLKEENFDMAIALLRSRLKDPHAHLPSPTNGSVDELSVMGHFLLALVLHTVVRRDKLFGMPEDDELLQTLWSANDGLNRYSYDKGTQATALEMLVSNLTRRDETVEALIVYRQLIEVLREMNKDDPTRTDPTMDEAGQEETPLDRLATALQSLASSCSDVYQHREAAEIMKQACEVVDELEGQGRTNPAMHVLALCLRAKFMDEAGIKGSNIFAKQAAAKLDEAIKVFAENTEHAVEEVLDNSDEMALFWVITATTLNTSLTDKEWREVYRGQSRKEVLTLAKERGIRVSKMPSNLRDGLPIDWDKTLGYFYITPLEALSSKVDSAQEEVAMLEKAVEVLLIQAPPRVPEFLKLPNCLPEEFSYSEFIKLFDWDAFNSMAACHLIISLPKLGVARLNLLNQLEMESKYRRNADAYDACMSIMVQEIKCGLEAAERYSKSPPTEEARKAMEVAKGELLILKGRVVARQKGGREEARQYWEDAKNALIDVGKIQTNGLDRTEKERLENLKLVEDLLKGAVEV